MRYSLLTGEGIENPVLYQVKLWDDRDYESLILPQQDFLQKIIGSIPEKLRSQIPSHLSLAIPSAIRKILLEHVLVWKLDRRKKMEVSLYQGEEPSIPPTWQSEEITRLAVSILSETGWEIS